MYSPVEHYFCFYLIFFLYEFECFGLFYVFSFPAGVYVGTLNLIAATPDPSILTLISMIWLSQSK